MQLTDEQKNAVKAVSGPVMVTAGPGSGKTHTMVHRIGVLIAQEKVAPRSILVITFTNKAADELRARVQKAQGDDLPYIGTFHSLAYDMLFTHGRLIGVPQPLKVATAKQQKEIIENLNLSGKTNELLRDISKRKRSNEPDEAVELYNKALREQGFIDFDDLISCSVQLLREHVPIRESYQDRFEYIIIDEYQDTDPLQAELLQLLAKPQNNVCVIGDLNQSIYAFRGANPALFGSFPEQFKNAQQLSLSTNFRSTKHIVQVSDAMMEQPPMQTVREGGDRVVVVEAPNEHAEMRYIIKTITSLIGGLDLNEASDGHYGAGDVAVLFRTHVMGRALAKAFEKTTIPFEYIGSIPFYDRAEIKLVLDLLLKDEIDEPLSEQIRTIIDGHNLKDQFNDQQYDRVLQLVSHALAHDHLDPSIARITLIQEAALAQAEQEEPLSSNSVHLMTIHAAKGLEFPIVFVVGVEEGNVPMLRNMGTRDNERLKEEQRLLYVAMTRAKDQLYLTHTHTRTKFGTQKNTEPSRFLKNIPPELAQRVVIKSQNKGSTQKSLL